MSRFFSLFVFLYKKRKSTLYKSLKDQYKNGILGREETSNRFTEGGDGNRGSATGDKSRWIPWITLQGDSTKAITRFLSHLLRAVEEVCLEGVWPPVWMPGSSAFWNCSRA